MTSINQTIPVHHVSALLTNGHYFAPCRSFVDLMEFRYGYCLFNTTADESNIERCIRRTFADERINRSIDSTCVSCWVANAVERFAMWEVYGKRDAAIRISIKAEPFCQYVTQQGHPIALGRVTYAGQTSMIRPQFITRVGLTEEQDETYDLFFHKHSFHAWEEEFRIVLFSSSAITVPVKDNLIESVIISPFGDLGSELEDALRQRFGDRVRPSALSSPYG